MEKIKSHLFEALLVTLLVKTMLAGSTFADAAVLVSLVVSICYTKHYLEKKKVSLDDEQLLRLDTVEKKVNTLTAGEAFKRNR